MKEGQNCQEGQHCQDTKCQAPMEKLGGSILDSIAEGQQGVQEVLWDEALQDLASQEDCSGPTHDYEHLPMGGLEVGLEDLVARHLQALEEGQEHLGAGVPLSGGPPASGSHWRRACSCLLDEP